MDEATAQSGPYYDGQLPGACGCYFPDVTRIRDDRVTKTRFFHCRLHGEVAEPLEANKPSLPAQEIPSEEWRQKERDKLRAKNKKAD